MFRLLQIVFFTTTALSCFGQSAKLNLVANPFVVFSGGTAEKPIKLIIDNPATDAITMSTAQTNGGIISEGDFNQVVWNVQNSNSATYTVPFTKSGAGPAIPVDITINAAGVQGTMGNIAISTFPSATWDNSTVMPNGVTNMAAAGTSNNSAKVIDRFWLLEANDYTTKPTITLDITYADAEHAAAGNTIGEAFLQAQRFNTSTGNWDGYAPSGTANTVTNIVSGITVTPDQFFRPWTLVDNRNPLPIELTEFKGDCENAQRNLYWTTASETNNNYFTIEKSIDGVEFIEIGKVFSLSNSGFSTSTLNYHYIDNNSVLGNYYRLKQTDFDGSFEYSGIIFNNCDDVIKPTSADVYPNPSHGIINVLLTGYEYEDITITVLNPVGQKVASRTLIGGTTTQKETFDITDLAKGIYYVNIITEKENITQKVINQH